MKKYLFFAAALVALASCSDEQFVGDNSPTMGDESGSGGAINFGLSMQNPTRAVGDPFVGATAAEKLGGMFVVEGTKGSEETSSPSTTVVFDNYLVGYTANTAGVTESNTHNWEYVGLQSGITSRMTAATWTALHSGTNDAKAQSVKYWDYTQDQYDFIAWSTGDLEAVTDGAVSGSKVKVTRINTGNTLATNGFTLTAASADDLLKCYYTDINTVLKANYGKPVTLTFKNMAAKVRVALYETVPGYSVKDVAFYISDENPTAPTDLGSGTVANATLFTMGSDKLPQSGSVLVCYPHIGSTEKAAGTKDYNKASVTVTPDAGTAVTKLAFGSLTAQYTAKEANEAVGNIYLGRTLPNATFAGDVTKNFYTAVIPNSNGKALTLRLDYTLVATDGAGEEIHVYGAKAVVPSTYTEWQPNYAYTYIFKISDNTNGWTSQTSTDPKGLFPITFDAVVTSFVDANAEQTTVTTVATPSITTYQQGHTKANNEYSKSQKAGKDAVNVKNLYVQVMDNSLATPALKADLNTAGKSLLFSVSKENASEAEVMDALQNHTADYVYNAASPVGRNGITLTANDNIDNTVTQIVNGVDDQPITVTQYTAAEIGIGSLAIGTYAYVYATTVPTSDERVYHLAADAINEASVKDKYYDVDPSSIIAAAEATAQANKVYFVANRNAKDEIVSYTFKQTKVGESVTGLYEATIVPATKASTYTAGHFYFDVYNQNNGAYAVKVIKVVD